MKKIDAIMNGTEQYSTFIEQLTNILEPFALLVKDYIPIYYGRQVESVSMGVCQDCGNIVFLINEEQVASINVTNGEASIYGRELVQLTKDDFKSVIEVATAVRVKEQVTNTYPNLSNEIQNLIKGIFHNGGSN